MFGLSALLTLLIIALFPKERERWISVSLIGLVVSILFFIEPIWAPSQLVKDIGRSVVDDNLMPSAYRIALMLMMLIGMRISVIMYKNQRFSMPTIPRTIQHSVAGITMGCGGAIALGGNDSQILMGIPAASFSAITVILFMLIGIVFEQYLYNRYNSLGWRIFSGASQTK